MAVLRAGTRPHYTIRFFPGYRYTGHVSLPTMLPCARMTARAA